MNQSDCSRHSHAVIIWSKALSVWTGFKEIMRFGTRLWDKVKGLGDRRSERSGRVLLFARRVWRVWTRFIKDFGREAENQYWPCFIVLCDIEVKSTWTNGTGESDMNDCHDLLMIQLITVCTQSMIHHQISISISQLKININIVIDVIMW